MGLKNPGMYRKYSQNDPQPSNPSRDKGMGSGSDKYSKYSRNPGGPSRKMKTPAPLGGGSGARRPANPHAKTY